jgi:hypothetical protein
MGTKPSENKTGKEFLRGKSLTLKTNETKSTE